MRSRKRSFAFSCRRISRARARSKSLSGSSPMKRAASSIASANTSEIASPPTFTASASGLSRAPSQTGQGNWLRYRERKTRTWSL